MSFFRQTRPLSLSHRLLVSFYVVIPLAFVALLVDAFWLERRIAHSLPRLPESLVLWSLLFPFPHILASYFSFFDRTYFLHYKNRLMYFAFPLFCLSLVLGVVLPDIAFLLFVLYSMIHITFQQTGITQLLFKSTHPIFFWWKWVLVVGATILYLSLYPSVLLPVVSTFTIPGIIVVSMISLAMTLYMTRMGHSAVGIWYAWGTTLLIPMGGFVWYLGYPILAILIPRVVHDLTAFAFYLTHDVNRNREVVHNLLYRPFIETRFVNALFVLIPIGALGCVLLLYKSPLIGGSLLVAFSVVHYYLESFMWKSGSPHRTHIAFSK
jgi:hypothetical protein